MRSKVLRSKADAWKGEVGGGDGIVPELVEAVVFKGEWRGGGFGSESGWSKRARRVRGSGIALCHRVLPRPASTIRSLRRWHETSGSRREAYKG